jgi:hypothetical protein
MKMKIDVQVQKKRWKVGGLKKTPPLPSSSSSSSTVPISLPGSVHTQESLFLSSLIHQMMMMTLFFKSQVKKRRLFTLWTLGLRIISLFFFFKKQTTKTNIYFC